MPWYSVNKVLFSSVNSVWSLVQVDFLSEKWLVLHIVACQTISWSGNFVPQCVGFLSALANQNAKHHNDWVHNYAIYQQISCFNLDALISQGQREQRTPERGAWSSENQRWETNHFEEDSSFSWSNLTVDLLNKWETKRKVVEVIYY